MDSGWSVAGSTDRAYVGTKSLKLTGTTSTPEITVNTSSGIALIPSHIYYSRVYGYQTKKAGGSVGFYWPIAEPNFREGIPLKAAGAWQLYSGRNNRTSFSAGSYSFRLDYNNNYVAGTMYFDGAMLIDLTACFGSGNEPSQEWMDEHVPYFAGSYDLEAYIITVPEITAVTVSPNPVNVRASYTVTVAVSEIKKFLTPTYFYAGDIYANEV